MKRKIILLKTFFIFFILLHGCNNIKHENKEEGKEKGEKILIVSLDLDDKYYYRKSCCLVPVERFSHLGIQTYSGFLIVEKVLSEKYDSFINNSIYQYCQCILYDDILYVSINNGNVMSHKSILLKIERNKYEIIVNKNSDIEFSVFAPIESTLRVSLNEFHVGDTIVGEISLFYRESSCGNEDDEVGYKCDGHFMGVINQGTEEWKDMLYHHSGKRFFQDK